MTQNSAAPVVLVVEDEHELRSLYVEWLSENYDVRSAATGREALRALDASVDVLLLDRRMPGLSGDTVLEKIDTESLECRVAMVTAVEPAEDIVTMNFDDYLVKPVSAPELYDMVERLLVRQTYDTALREYFSLVSKRAVLENEHPQSRLAESQEYQRLVARINELDSETAAIREGLAEAEFEQVLKDITNSRQASSEN